ncbi:MAG: GntR family transcriptional regulator [Bryobacteraceae bacterium]|nr:GntR family transcriptional regulator [Bryobacteraceae bacterium]
MSSAPVVLTQIGRRRATDEVYDILRRGILQHLFAPGERLNIDDLARKLGVSLTPVRHAIQQLAAEGLVEVRPRSGTFVATLSQEEIAETFDIRRALECLAAESAVDLITGEEIERMSVLVADMARPVRSEEDVRRHEANNSEFHKILIEGSGNKRLYQMYEELKAHLQIGRVHSAAAMDWRERLQRERSEHEEILAAVRARDKQRLVKALRDHIDRAKHALIRSLEANE